MSSVMYSSKGEAIGSSAEPEQFEDASPGTPLAALVKAICGEGEGSK